MVSNPGDGVGGTKGVLQPGGRGGEQLFADFRAQLFSYLAEIVDVDVEHGHHGLTVAGEGEGVTQEIRQESGGNKPGQRVDRGVFCHRHSVQWELSAPTDGDDGADEFPNIVQHRLHPMTGRLLCS